jgi:hypothetical protein
MKPRRMMFTALVLFSVVSLAACGGGSDPKSSTAAATSDSSSGTSSGSTAFKGNNSGDFCSYAKDIENDSSLNDAFSSSTDAKTMKEGFQKAADIYNTAVGKAPSEIKADMQTMQKAIKALSDFYASYGYDMTKMQAAVAKDPTLATKMQAFSSDEFSKASERVDAYFTQVCGIDTSK